MWPLTEKHTLTAFRYQMAFCLQAICKSFRRICIYLNSFGHLLIKNITLFEWLGHLFVENTSLFNGKLLVYIFPWEITYFLWVCCDTTVKVISTWSSNCPLSSLCAWINNRNKKLKTFPCRRINASTVSVLNRSGHLSTEALN